MTGMDDANKSPIETGAGRPIAAVIVGVALLLGISFDVLFYDRRPGVSFLVYMGLIVVALLGVAAYGRTRWSWASLTLALPMLLLAALVAVRSEPLTTFLNVVVSLALLLLWMRMFGGWQLGRWGVTDVVVEYVLAGVALVAQPFIAATAAFRQASTQRGAAIWTPVLRGLLFALPLLCAFTLLLTSADLIFRDQVGDILTWLNLDNIPELTVRIILMLMAAGTITAILAEALQQRFSVTRRHEDPLIKPFIGLTEATIVLASINLLFAFFVIVQFRYLFGGADYVLAGGFSYSEYARRGFGELVTVVALTLAILLALAHIMRRERPVARWVFFGLAVLVTVFVVVIDISALQRLLTYEAVFGFTRLRTYSHVAIIWLGVLFVPFVVALLFERLQWFASGIVLCVVGFTLTLNYLNVDAFIAETNIRYNISQIGSETTLPDGSDRVTALDASYLTRLSTDAIPALVVVLDGDDADAQAVIGPYLSCWQVRLDAEVQADGWQSWHAGRREAAAVLAAADPGRRWRLLPPADEEATDDIRAWHVETADGETPCRRYFRGNGF